MLTVAAGCSRRYYAIKARDAAGNWSTISNVPFAQAACPRPPVQCYEKAVPQPPEPTALPTVLELSSPVPNPASVSALVEFAIPADRDGQRYELSIYDLVGRRVASLGAGTAVPGTHTISWDLRSSSGQRVAKGVYYVRLKVGERSLTKILVSAR